MFLLIFPASLFRLPLFLRPTLSPCLCDSPSGLSAFHDCRYTVQCPAECGKFDTTVWGCERFLDSSSICKAAIMSGKIGFESGGYVSFELVDPHPSYQVCIRNICLRN
ncbi:MAG: LCCL domain-containing protein [Promethearchaeia archaeon]